MFKQTIPVRQTTMLNLQIKRTLPRQVIKWMQELDLSYSIKDYRKDLINGFLIGQIISRYQPGKIHMHAFQNTQNTKRRDNNWNLLDLFFTKNTLKDVEIEHSQYDKIMDCHDPKSQQLHQFMCRLYSICKKRPIPQNPPNVDLPPTQSNNPNLTTSFLLKDEGLQKLNISGRQQSLNNSGLLNEQVRVPTRKISPHIQQPSQVDLKSVGVWGEGNKQTSKRKSWNIDAKDESQNSEDNNENERYIFDYLNDILEECLNSSEKFENTRKNLFQNQTKNPTQILKNNITNLEQQLLCTFFTQVHLSLNELVPIILRQANEIWKFYVYFIKFLRIYGENSQQFNLLIELIGQFARASNQRESKRINKVFFESLIQCIVAEVKASNSWRKSHKIMGLVYDFGGRNINQKKIVLFKLKTLINSNESLYVEWLSQLIRQEESNSELLEDYLYYAFQNIGQANFVSRTSAFKILLFIATISDQLVEQYFLQNSQSLSQVRQPQQIYLIVSVYFILLNSIITSNQYQNLIKGNNSNNLMKVYNPDNQKQAQQLKNKVNLINDCILNLYTKTQNIMVRQFIARNAVKLLAQHRSMMKIFLQQTSNQRSQQFLKQKALIFQFKSLESQLQKIDLNKIQQQSNEILIQIMNCISNGENQLQEYIFLINYCLEFINIKKINMQVWEDISLHLAQPYAKLLMDQNYTLLAKQGICNLLSIYFNFDMKIRELNKWLYESIALIIINKNIKCLEAVGELNQWLNDKYDQTKNQSIKYTVDQLSEGLESKGHKDILKLSSTIKLISNQ